MSRNLCSTSCHQCGGHVMRVSGFRPAGEVPSISGSRYVHEFEDVLFCDARCAGCGAAYLGWGPRESWGGNSESISDLSYRSTFNDEPDARDLPLVDPPTREELLAKAMVFEDMARARDEAVAQDGGQS